MKLDRATYEAWLLDRVEGLLSPALEKELDAFLRANPDLRPSTAGLPKIDGGDAEFPLKNALRKDYPPTGMPDAGRLNDFFVARAEGDLSSEQEKQLDHFLYENPEAGKHAAWMALAHVPKEPIAFPSKEKLERHFPPKGMPDVHRLTDFLIAELEGDLSGAQRAALKHYVSVHPEAVREERLVAATRTVPAVPAFPGKAGLKKRDVRGVALWPRLAAAACFLLLMGAGWWFLREKPEETKEVARVEKPAAPQEVRSSISNKAPTGTKEPEAAGSNGYAPKGVPPAPMGKPVSAKEKQPSPVHQPEQHRASEQTPGPQAEPLQKPTPVSLPSEGPALAQQTEKPTTIPNAPGHAENGAALKEKEAVPPSAHAQGSGQDLGTFVANTLRGEVLDTPKRKAVLDGGDAVAFADKAIGVVTGGQGGVQVQHTSEGRRFQLRLGRNFSVSASSGH